jgi:hypothetical protein
MCGIPSPSELGRSVRVDRLGRFHVETEPFAMSDLSDHIETLTTRLHELQQSL